MIMPGLSLWPPYRPPLWPLMTQCDHGVTAPFLTDRGPVCVMDTASPAFMRLAPRVSPARTQCAAARRPASSQISTLMQITFRNHDRGRLRVHQSRDASQATLISAGQSRYSKNLEGSCRSALDYVRTHKAVSSHRTAAPRKRRNREIPRSSQLRLFTGRSSTSNRRRAWPRWTPQSRSSHGQGRQDMARESGIPGYGPGHCEDPVGTGGALQGLRALQNDDDGPLYGHSGAAPPVTRHAGRDARLRGREPRSLPA